MLLSKIFMRYIAKISVIQNKRGNEKIGILKTIGDTWSHWEDGSSTFFHYDPEIEFELLNSFFPFLELNANIDSIEFIKLIKDKNNSFKKQDEAIFSIDKIEILLTEIEENLIYEKNIYDSNSSKWLKIKNENEKKNNFNRSAIYTEIVDPKIYQKQINRKLLHSLDSSPLEILK